MSYTSNTGYYNYPSASPPQAEPQWQQGPFTHSPIGNPMYPQQGPQQTAYPNQPPPNTAGYHYQQPPQYSQYGSNGFVPTPATQAQQPQSPPPASAYPPNGAYSQNSPQQPPQSAAHGGQPYGPSSYHPGPQPQFPQPQPQTVINNISNYYLTSQTDVHNYYPCPSETNRSGHPQTSPQQLEGQANTSPKSKETSKQTSWFGRVTFPTVLGPVDAQVGVNRNYNEMENQIAMKPMESGVSIGETSRPGEPSPAQSTGKYESYNSR